MKVLKCLLVVTLFFFACEKECELPPCPKPNLNQYANLTLQFCMDVNDESCFSNDELGEVIFTQKRIATDDIISSTSITNLEENNFSIQIGSESSEFLFGDQVTGGDVLEEVEYFYEVEVIATGGFYKIGTLKFQTDEEPCSCPSYDFASVEVNDVSMEVVGNIVILKK